ncbi:hypothetical protein H0B56_13025 [Haloechinothrix sp. YIM 98757]|uniref:Uncharacterized protein n=2 Tax=Haloechinothrix aidingensis TaxID=2752311 RepID=A0A838AB71_9PSEU|nr:hypothetical protein [Haloechinothrix aidingensis]MBA0126466.1 hypothetical protein [Haloechinothrix aidingensis]
MCGDTGTMSWQQPYPDGVLRTIEWPCPRGCGGHWTHPAAEQDRVIEQPDELPDRRHEGNVAEANRIGGDFIVAALERWGIDHPALRDDRDD